MDQIMFLKQVIGILELINVEASMIMVIWRPKKQLSDLKSLMSKLRPRVSMKRMRITVSLPVITISST